MHPDSRLMVMVVEEKEEEKEEEEGEGRRGGVREYSGIWEPEMNKE